MNIQKLNPFGCEAKTEKGNTYKKANTATIGAAILTANSIAAYTSKNAIVRAFTTSSILDTLEEIAKIKITPKAKPFVLGACTVIDAIGGFYMLRAVDKMLNAKRAQKADEAAETVNTQA